MVQLGAHPGGQEAFGRQLRWVERLADGVEMGAPSSNSIPYLDGLSRFGQTSVSSGVNGGRHLFLTGML